MEEDSVTRTVHINRAIYLLYELLAHSHREKYKSKIYLENVFDSRTPKKVALRVKLLVIYYYFYTLV